MQLFSWHTRHSIWIELICPLFPGWSTFERTRRAWDESTQLFHQTNLALILIAPYEYDQLLGLIDHEKVFFLLKFFLSLTRNLADMINDMPAFYLLNCMAFYNNERLSSEFYIFLETLLNFQLSEQLRFYCDFKIYRHFLIGTGKPLITKWYN